MEIYYTRQMAVVNVYSRKELLDLIRMLTENIMQMSVMKTEESWEISIPQQEWSKIKDKIEETFSGNF